jgi:hypothetical protein
MKQHQSALSRLTRLVKKQKRKEKRKRKNKILSLCSPPSSPASSLSSPSLFLKHKHPLKTITFFIHFISAAPLRYSPQTFSPDFPLSLPTPSAQSSVLEV